MTHDEYFAYIVGRLSYRSCRERKRRAVAVSLKILGATVVAWGAVIMLALWVKS